MGIHVDKLTILIRIKHFKSIVFFHLNKLRKFNIHFCLIHMNNYVLPPKLHFCVNIKIIINVM